MDVNKYRALFIEESREHVAEMSRLLVELESSNDRGPLIDEVFRHAHSIKSMAASMGYDPIATLAHRLEDVIGLHRKSGAAFAAPTVDALLRSVDALTQQVQCIADGRQLDGYFELVRTLGALAQVEPPPPPPMPEGEDPFAGLAVVMVRLVAECPAPPLRMFLVHRRLSELGPIAKMAPSLDDVKAGRLKGRELRVAFGSAQQEADVRRVLAQVPDIESVTFEEGGRRAVAVFDEAKPVAETPERLASLATVRVRTDLLDDIMDSIGELFIVRERLRMLLGLDARSPVLSAMDDLGTRIHHLHDQVIAARMMPMRTLTDRYPRLVRDLCRSLGKEVELEIRGRDIEIDRAILDNLDAPFIHLLRNAVDHGIESTAERHACGKSPVGKVTISATRERDHVLVMIEDDGAGIDPVQLRRTAVERGVLTDAQAQALNVRETLYLICLPGFSTKAEVSDISGRGVGMDVVSARIESVGGSLGIESEVGKGTRFIFRLPLTLAIIPVLLVRAAGRVLALPVAKVVTLREANDEILTQADGGRFLSFRQGLHPVLSLAELLGLPKPPAPETFVAVVEAGLELFALGVDAVVGYHEVVLKPLGDPLENLECYAGVTILGDGQPILILDLSKIVRLRTAA